MFEISSNIASRPIYFRSLFKKKKIMIMLNLPKLIKNISCIWKAMCNHIRLATYGNIRPRFNVRHK